MKNACHRYLIRLQYLGFRYSGWQKQPDVKTIEGMLTKTLRFMRPDDKFNILGAGRTDAKVSALNAAFELFIEGDAIHDADIFLDEFNLNLPPDIRVMEISNVNADFNVIQDVKIKEYIYLFSYGEKNHPFCAPFLVNILEDLDIASMQEAANHFVGTYDFSRYTARLQKKTKVVRTINCCEIDMNDMLDASFFPSKSYKLTVRGKGFMRYQVRMMMGVLIQVGKGELSQNDVRLSLTPEAKIKLDYIAPRSGLLLNDVDFN